MRHFICTSSPVPSTKILYLNIIPCQKIQINKGWNDTETSSWRGSGQGWEQAETYSSFVLLPIQVFTYEYTCTITRLCMLQFTHDRFLSIWLYMKAVLRLALQVWQIYILLFISMVGELKRRHPALYYHKIKF